MNYIKVTFRTEEVEEFANDLIASFLGEVGFESFEETSRGIIGYCPENDFNETAMREAIQSMPLSDVSLISFKIETIADQNWNALWEQNGYEPIDVDGRIIIHAADHKVEKKYEYDIIINPVQSFGTGYHETTRMILSTMLDMPIADKNVLDMGCGTAVLGILARMRGADHVTAIDIDEWSERNAKSNVEANGLDGFNIHLGDAALLSDMTASFDLVLANINRNILLRDMPEYVNAMRPDAEIIMSGFYFEDLDLIRKKAESLGLQFVAQCEDNEWTAVRFRK